MTTILHIDSSARGGLSGRDPYGSHSRRLSARFVQQWLAGRPDTRVIYRDVGQHPPPPVTGAWIQAAFTPAAVREPWMYETLATSDALVDELIAADIVVAGVPMYNFGPPRHSRPGSTTSCAWGEPSVSIAAVRASRIGRCWPAWASAPWC